LIPSGRAPKQGIRRFALRSRSDNGALGAGIEVIPDILADHTAVALDGVGDKEETREPRDGIRSDQPEFSIFWRN